MSFYDELAGRYDAITGASARAAGARKFVEELVRRYAPKTALDAACGTGLYALELARAGVAAVGSDLSEPMLQQARATAQAQGLSVQWMQTPMQELGSRGLDEQFDIVLCMGNSIPHLPSDAELGSALSGFARLLVPGGRAVVQLLNYARVLQRGERIVGIDRQGDDLYIRFYDFLEAGRLVQFNILHVGLAGQTPSHDLHSTTLRPYRADELASALRRAGFAEVELFGSLGFDPFDPQQSETVMLVGCK